MSFWKRAMVSELVRGKDLFRHEMAALGFDTDTVLGVPTNESNNP
jgi:hypothetical protein